MTLVVVLFALQTRQREVVSLLTGGEPQDPDFIVPPPTKEPERKKPEEPVYVPPQHKKAPPVVKTEVMKYRELDSKLLALTDSNSVIAATYFEDNILAANHPVFAIEPFKNSMTENQVKNRFLKMLKVSAFLHQPTVEAMLSGTEKITGKVQRLDMSGIKDAQFLPPIVTCMT